VGKIIGEAKKRERYKLKTRLLAGNFKKKSPGYGALATFLGNVIIKLSEMRF
jgi:hypothetical protein